MSWYISCFKDGSATKYDFFHALSEEHALTLVPGELVDLEEYGWSPGASRLWWKFTDYAATLWRG